MQNFFFVPGNKLHKVPDILRLNVNEIIIDMEDAIKESERGIVSNHLIEQPQHSYYIRVPLYNAKMQLDLNLLNELIENQYTKFVFPKIQSNHDLKTIIDSLNYKNFQIILLIESPGFLLELKDVLYSFKGLIRGLGLGSHDFMAEIGGVHTLKNLEFTRQLILYMARSISATAIDIASMELNSEEHLRMEIIDGFEKGYDAKFYIHPWQIEVANRIKLYSENELIWAKQVLKQLDKIGGDGEFNPIVINGQIIEKPHLTKAKKILKYYGSK